MFSRVLEVLCCLVKNVAGTSTFNNVLHFSRIWLLPMTPSKICLWPGFFSHLLFAFRFISGSQLVLPKHHIALVLISNNKVSEHSSLYFLRISWLCTFLYLIRDPKAVNWMSSSSLPTLSLLVVGSREIKMVFVL